jgi:sarcosine oxidase
MALPFPASLWAHTAVPAAPHPALNDRISTDAVVIGAGFTGLRAALVLAEAGTDVVVLDAADVGWGASGRTGGQVNPMLPFNTPQQIRKRVGGLYFERLTAASLNSADALFTLIRRHNIDCQARQNGWLRVDHCEKARRQSVSNALIWNQYGAEMQPLDAHEVQQLSGSPRYRSGILNPRGGAVQPLSLARGLAATASHYGAKIYGNSPVSDLTQTPQGWTVSTPQGQVHATWVIIATNGYTGGLLKGLSASILPLLPIQIATDPLSADRIADILPQGQTISDTRRVIMYARREPDNRFVFGGHGNMQANGKAGGFEWLVRDAGRIFPTLKGVHWKFRWGGNIALTSDRLPHLHEPKPGLLAGLGYNGRGVAMSHVMGRVLAERVLGKAQQDLAFPVTDIKKYPFRSAQMMGESTAIGWMRLLDYLDARGS